MTYLPPISSGGVPGSQPQGRMVNPSTAELPPHIAEAWDKLLLFQKKSILKAFEAFGLDIQGGKVSFSQYDPKGFSILNSQILDLSCDINSVCELTKDKILKLMQTTPKHSVRKNDEALLTRIQRLPEQHKTRLYQLYPGLASNTPLSPEVYKAIHEDTTLCELFGSQLKCENLGCTFGNFTERTSVFTRAKNDFLQIQECLTQGRIGDLPCQHMYVYGPAGVGKTHFTLAAVKMLLPLLEEGWSIYFLPIRPSKELALQYMCALEEPKSIFVLDDLQSTNLGAEVDLWARLTRSMHENGGSRFLISTSNYDILRVLYAKKNESGNFDVQHAACRRMTERGAYYDFKSSDTSDAYTYVPSGYTNHGKQCRPDANDFRSNNVTQAAVAKAGVAALQAAPPDRQTATVNPVVVSSGTTMAASASSTDPSATVLPAQPTSNLAVDSFKISDGLESKFVELSARIEALVKQNEFHQVSELNEKQIAWYFSKGPISKFKDQFALNYDNCCAALRLRNSVIFNFTGLDVRSMNGVLTVNGSIMKQDGNPFAFPVQNQFDEPLLFNIEGDEYCVYFIAQDRMQKVKLTV